MALKDLIQKMIEGSLFLGRIIITIDEDNESLNGLSRGLANYFINIQKSKDQCDGRHLSCQAPNKLL